MPELIVPASQVTSIREATPTTPYPDPEVMVIDGSANEVRGLVDIDMVVPIGEDATVVGAFLQLHRAEALPAGPHSGTIAPLAASFDQDTVTWDTAPSTRTPTAAISIPGAGAAGDMDEFDLTAMYSASVTADDAPGTQWFGVRIVTTAAAALRFFSLFADPDYVPKLRVVYSLPGEAPDEGAPNGITGKTKPYLVAHAPGAEAITAIEVEAATDATFDGTVVFASGERVKTSAELDLNLEAGFTALTAGQTRYWHMRTKNENGVWSPWGDTWSFTYQPNITVALDDLGTITTYTPTYEWTITGGDQHAYELEVMKKLTDLLPGVLFVPVYRLPMLEVTPGTTGTVTQPDDQPLEPGSYRVYVRAIDDEDRSASPGDSIEAEDFDDFVVVEPDVDPLLTLTLTQPSTGVPEVLLAWTHGTPASVDRWTVGYKLPGRPMAIYGIFDRDALGSAGSYSISVPSPTDTEWFVGALDAAGVASDLRSAEFSGDVKGTWLMASRNGQLYNGSGSRADLRVGFSGGINRRRQLEATLHNAPYSAARVLDVSRLHTWEGEIDGSIKDRSLKIAGVTTLVTISVFEDRLEALVGGQKSYRVALVTARRLFPDIGFTDGLDASDDPNVAERYQPTRLGFIAL